MDPILGPVRVSLYFYWSVDPHISDRFIDPYNFDRSVDPYISDCYLDPYISDRFMDRYISDRPLILRAVHRPQYSGRSMDPYIFLSVH